MLRVGAVRQVRTSLSLDSDVVLHAAQRPRYSMRAAVRLAFTPHAPPPVEVPRREVLLDTLRSPPAFETDPADGIEGVEVLSLEFFSTGGGTARFERRGDDETIHEFLGRCLGPLSPLRAHGWTIYAATLRIKRAARDATRGKTLTVTLRAPNTTTLPNTTEADRHYALDLLERWGLIAPPPQDVEVTEDF